MHRIAMLILVFLLVSCSEEIYLTDLSDENDRLRIENLRLNSRNIELRNKVEEKNHDINRLIREMKELEKDRMPPPSPPDRLKSENVEFFSQHVNVNTHDAFGAIFAGTRSMEPLINKDSLAIQIPANVEIMLGDIIAFKSEESDSIVVHRVIASGEDEEGWFAITKGDNNRKPDPWKVRKDDLIGVTLGILY